MNKLNLELCLDFFFLTKATFKENRKENHLDSRIRSGLGIQWWSSTTSDNWTSFDNTDSAGTSNTCERKGKVLEKVLDWFFSLNLFSLLFIHTVNYVWSKESFSFFLLDGCNSLLLEKQSISFFKVKQLDAGFFFF